jgi:hypothetical protein
VARRAERRGQLALLLSEDKKSQEKPQKRGGLSGAGMTMESSELQKTIKAVLEQIKRHELDFFVYSGATQYGSSSQFVDLVCRKTTTYKSCCLFLTTPGGDPHSAYRIIRCLRSKYPDKVTLAVAGPCKSAGTLIALGAHEIAMSPTGELGPLDVQLTKPDEIIPNGPGLERFQALAVTTTHAFEAFERCMLDIIEHSLGSISLSG